MEATLFQIARPLAAIAWGLDAWDHPMRLVLIAREADGGVLEPIILHRFAGGRSHLAAFVDSDNRVLEWLECSVQAPRDLAESPAARCGLLSNAVLDLEWKKAVAAARELHPADFIATRWEQRPAEPLVIDLEKKTLVRLVQADSKKPFVLCRDDAALKAAGLGDYGTSLDRAFQAPLADGGVKWISLKDLTLDATGAAGVALEGGGTGPWLDFNTAAGAMVLRRFRPIALTTFADWLRSGVPVQPASAQPAAPTATDDDHENAALRFVETAALAAATSAPNHAGWLFEDNAGLESLHLRLALWHALVAETHRTSTRTARPFFNLSPESFRVSLQPGAALVPPAWLFEVAVARPGEATPFKSSDGTPRFVPGGPAFESPSLERFGGWRMGNGTLRFSTVSDAGDGQVRLEGSIDGSALRDSPEHSLVWVQLSVENRPVSFVATLEAEQTAGRSGMRFKALVRNLPAGVVTQLKSALAPRRQCQYCLLLPVSAALDVNALGKIGIRLLLAADPAAVAEIEDDLYELAGLLPHPSSVEHLRYLAETPDLSERLRRVLSPDAWQIDGAAGARIPANLWHAIVHELMEFVAVEDGSADENAPAAAGNAASETAWLEPLAARLASLKKLTVHTRGLLAGPRAAHEDIARVIHRFVGSSL